MTRFNVFLQMSKANANMHREFYFYSETYMLWKPTCLFSFPLPRLHLLLLKTPSCLAAECLAAFQHPVAL